MVQLRESEVMEDGQSVYEYLINRVMTAHELAMNEAKIRVLSPKLRREMSRQFGISEKTWDWELFECNLRRLNVEDRRPHLNRVDRVVDDVVQSFSEEDRKEMLLAYGLEDPRDHDYVGAAIREASPLTRILSFAIWLGAIALLVHACSD